MSSYRKRIFGPPLPSRGEFFMTGVIPISSVPDENCAICTDALENSAVQILTCQHSFHTMCILTWLSATDGVRNRSCPNCRVCLFDQTNPGPQMAPDPAPDLQFGSLFLPEVPRSGHPTERYLFVIQQRRAAAERIAAANPPAPPNHTVCDLPPPGRQSGVESDQAAASLAAASLAAEFARPLRPPHIRRTRAGLRPTRPRATRPSRAIRGVTARNFASDNTPLDSPPVAVPTSSREQRLAGRIRRREEAEAAAAAALRRHG